MMPTCPCGKDPASRVEIPPRVLVIDDEALVRWSLATGLRAAGFDAVAAIDGPQARALARELPHPDVVLLDGNLWNADVRRLLADLQEISARCRFLILLVAGQDIALPPWDTVDVIRKPFDLPAVIQLVEAAVRRPACRRKVAV